MTFKSCKYGCNTQIQWDTELGAFRESDGKLHDRKRCEGMRNNGTSAPSQTASVTPPQQQQQQQVSSATTTSATYDVAQALNTIVQKIQVLSEYYDGLLTSNKAIAEGQQELYRSMQSIIFRDYDKREQEKADAEARYDQDKEDGTLNA